MPDPIPDFLKDVIVANSTLLFTLLLGLGVVGLWTLARGVFRRVRSGSEEGWEVGRRAVSGRRRGWVEPAVVWELTDALDAAHRRIAELEAKVEFDRRLERGR